MKPGITVLIAVLWLPVVVQAHYIWIESAIDSEARIYFGEYNEGVREKAGGRLDERENMQGYIQQVNGNQIPVKFRKESDHFSINVSGNSGWLVIEDITNDVMDWRKSNIGIVKPMFYARTAISNKTYIAKPTLALDIIPVSENSRQSYQVYFRNTPLAGAKLMVYAPNMWMQELKTDENGKLEITTPWTGLYVIEVIHLETTPGSYKDKEYELIRHRSTYTFFR